jgi:methylated-DNA-[protein]-cysteine S-methyltransferase
MTHTTVALQTSVGTLLLRGTDEHLTHLTLPNAVGSAPDDYGESPVVHHAAEQVREYLAGSRRHFDIPMDPPGTAFQRQVWDALSTIPFGETLSYGQIAAEIGRPGASRAVGQANGRNPIAIIIPCHRVIAGGGRIGGYGGGLDLKRTLLALEGVQLGA